MRRVLSYLVALGVASVVQAAPLINNTGLPSPAQTITFSEVPLATGAPVTNEYAAFGVTFPSSGFYDPEPLFFPTPALGDYVLGGPTHNPFSILFTTVQTDVAFALQSNPGTTTFTALLSSVPVEQFSVATALSVLPDVTHASDYYGFTGIAFDEIQIQAPVNGALQIDNLQTGVPEPAAAAIFLAGALGMALRRRRHT